MPLPEILCLFLRSFILLNPSACQVNHFILIVCRNTLESIAPKQNMTYSCNCLCMKTKDTTNQSSDNTADEFVNPDDVNIIVPESAIKLGHSPKSSDKNDSGKDENEKDFTDEIKDQNDVDKGHNNSEENNVTPRWQIIRTTPTDPKD